MPTGLIQTSPPSAEPFEVDEAREHLRVDYDNDNKLIGGLIRAARQLVEARTGLQLVTATWRADYDRFPRYSQLGGLQYASESLWSQRIPQTELSGRYWPDRATFRMPRPPLQSVQQIVYVDGATGSTFIMDPSQYLVDNGTRPGRIAPVPGGIWPTVKQQLGAVQITYVAGYGQAKDVPETIKLAMKLLIGHWYENREASTAGTQTMLPMAVESLLATEWPGEYF